MELRSPPFEGRRAGRTGLCLLFLLPCLLLPGCSSGRTTPEAIDGTIDLRGWAFHENGALSLNGRWSFWSGVLLEPQAALGAAPEGFLEVPGSWAGFTGGTGKPMGPYGAGTYLLRVKMPAGARGLAMAVKDEAISYRCFFDGKEVAANGRPGPGGTDSLVLRRRVAIPLPEDVGELAVMFHVSNDQYNVGGLINPVRFGPAGVFEVEERIWTTVQGMLLGILFIMGLYHLFLFLQRRSDRAPLFVCLFCFFIFLRTVSLEQLFELLWHGDGAFAFTIRLEFLTFYAAVPVYMAFIRNLFPREFPSLPYRAALIAAAPFCASVAVLPPRLFMAWTLIPFQAFTLLCSLLIVRVTVRAVREGRTGARTALVGYVLFFGFIVNDILHANLVIRTAYLAPMGLSVFVVFQSLIVARVFGETHEDVKRLSEELAAEKTTLQEKVRDRTRELEESNRKLREMDRTKNEFFAGISHELRTPLTLILAPVDSLLRDASGGGDGRGLYLQIRRNARKIQRIVENLFDFARMETAKLKPDMRLLDAARFSRILAAELSSVAQTRRIALTFEDASGGGAWIAADNRLLDSALTNVVLNALKFTPEGGSVAIRLERGGRTLRIVVKDNGIGISPQDLPHVFEKFYQGGDAPRGGSEGIGIGLAMTQEIVRLHGGSVSVESEPGRGAVFTLSFPLLDSSAGESAAKVLEVPGERAAAGEGRDRDAERKTVLVCEDNEELLGFLASELEPRYRVLRAGNGREALDLLDGRRPPAVILSDVMMPVMDGKTFFQEVRARGDLANVPFLFLTARADETEKLESLAAGVFDYVCKPFVTEELITKIDAIVSYGDNVRDVTKRVLLQRLQGALEGDDGPSPRRADDAQRLFPAGLTDRDHRIVDLLRTGLQDKEIAARLETTPKAVSNALARIYRRFGVSNRIQLMNLLR